MLLIVWCRNRDEHKNVTKDTFSNSSTRSFTTNNTAKRITIFNKTEGRVATVKNIVIFHGEIKLVQTLKKREEDETCIAEKSCKTNMDRSSRDNNPLLHVTRNIFIYEITQKTQICLKSQDVEKVLDGAPHFRSLKQFPPTGSTTWQCSAFPTVPAKDCIMYCRSSQS